LGKPASLHATTAFLASNVYAGQHPKPQHRVPTPKGKPYIGSSDWDYYIGSQTGTTIPTFSVDTKRREGNFVGKHFPISLRPFFPTIRVARIPYLLTNHQAVNFSELGE